MSAAKSCTRSGPHESFRPRGALRPHLRYTKADPGLESFRTVLVKRLRVQGFIIIDFASRFMEAATQTWSVEDFGKLKDRETIVEGLEKAPDAINMLFTGGNIGKLIVKV